MRKRATIESRVTQTKTKHENEGDETKGTKAKETRWQRRHQSRQTETKEADQLKNRYAAKRR